MNNLSNILIFRTSLNTPDDVEKISALLNDKKEIKEWSVDLEDRENILRVVSSNINTNDIIESLEQLNFSCEELED